MLKIAVDYRHKLYTQPGLQTWCICRMTGLRCSSTMVVWLQHTQENPSCSTPSVHWKNFSIFEDQSQILLNFVKSSYFWGFDWEMMRERWWWSLPQLSPCIQELAKLWPQPLPGISAVCQCPGAGGSRVSQPQGLHWFSLQSCCCSGLQTACWWPE